MIQQSDTKRNLKEHSWYFGVYANMARHNVFKILNEIAERTGTKRPGSESNMRQADVIACLNGEGNNKERNLPDIQRQVVKRLHEYFRFLKALNKTLNAESPDYKMYYGVLRSFLEQLDNVRNEMSHAVHGKSPFNPELIGWMEYIFDDGLKELRTRVPLNEQRLLPLKRYEGLDADARDSNGKKIKRAKLNNAFQYSFFENGTITEKGLAFFICLFLEPEYSYVFLKKLAGFKRGGTPEEKATLQVYTIYSARQPQIKLQSDVNDVTALLMDMLNELQRCPNELYETLSEEDKAIFITKMESAIDEDEKTGEERDSILKRSQNRFPYFALRYLDSMEIFKGLRFHIDLGNYHFKNYPKEMDNMTINRRWEKKLLTFGRLQDFDDLHTPPAFRKLLKDPASINDSTAAPFIPISNPHYNFSGIDEKNIGIKDIRIKKGNVEYDPWLSIMEGKKPGTSEPDFFLATDELTGLLLIDYFAKKYNVPGAETIITDYGRRVKRMLIDFSEGKIPAIQKGKITNQVSSTNVAELLNERDFEKEYKDRKSWLSKMLPYELKPHQVPDTICKYLMGIEPVAAEERALRIAETLLEQTKTLISRTQTAKKGTKEFNKKKERKRQQNLHLKAGDTALFLARDLLFMQPPFKNEKGETLPKGKANPDEFQLLQARLAFFGGEKNNLPATFRLCNLIESENPHPFLEKIKLANCRNNLDFYLAYLAERKSFLESLIKNAEFDKHNFLVGAGKGSDEEYFKDLAKTIASKPVNLPRGLFKDALIEMLQVKGNDAMKILVAGEKVRHNVIFLINELYKQEGDSYQKFYDFSRNYRTVDEWYDDRPFNSIKPIKELFKTTEELTSLAIEIKKSGDMKLSRKGREFEQPFYNVYAKKVIENEKFIRHYRAADQMLFLMTKGLLTKVNTSVKDALSGFLLRNISPDNERSILETRIDFSIPFKTGSEEKHVFDNFKIKDYGKFRKYLKDRRIPSLLFYFKESTIPKSELDKQLKDYENARLALYSSIYNFEEAMAANKKFEERIKEEKQLNYLEHYKLLDWYLGDAPEKEIIKQRLNEIRKKFSHNEFPDFDMMKIILTGEKPFIDEILEYATSLYKEFTENLNTKTT